MIHGVLRALTAAAIGIGPVAAAAPALASATAGGVYRLRATVPVACWVRPSSPLLASSGRSGEVVEACNSPGGFTVSAQYRPLSQFGAALRITGHHSHRGAAPTCSLAVRPDGKLGLERVRGIEPLTFSLGSRR